VLNYRYRLLYKHNDARGGLLCCRDASDATGLVHGDRRGSRWREDGWLYHACGGQAPPAACASAARLPSSMVCSANAAVTYYSFPASGISGRRWRGLLHRFGACSCSPAAFLPQIWTVHAFLKRRSGVYLSSRCVKAYLYSRRLPFRRTISSEHGAHTRLPVVPAARVAGASAAGATFYLTCPCILPAYRTGCWNGWTQRLGVGGRAGQATDGLAA